MSSNQIVHFSNKQENMSQLGRAISAVRIQISILVFLSVLFLLSHTRVIPSPEQVATGMSALFRDYGIPMVAICSFIENIIGVNAYFPGSIVILVAMGSTAGNPQLAIVTYFAIVIPAVIAHHVNYFIGWVSTEKATAFATTIKSSKGAQRNQWVWFFSTLWHPHFAAMTCLICGAYRIRYLEFAKYYIVAGVFWTSFWALLVYHLGHTISSHPQLAGIVYLYTVIWLLVDLWRFQRKSISATSL